MEEQKSLELSKGLGERGGEVSGETRRGGGQAGQGRAGLRCSGGSNRVVCYLSTSDRSHLLQGEAEEVSRGKEQTLGKKKLVER